MWPYEKNYTTSAQNCRHSSAFYHEYILNEDIPIEAVIQICLLFKDVRKVVQLDKYVYSEETWRKIEEWLLESSYFLGMASSSILTNVANYSNPTTNVAYCSTQDTPSNRNYMSQVVYYFNRNKQKELSDIILFKKSDIDISAMINDGRINDVLANYLDMSFYGLCQFGYKKDKLTDVARVSINVMGPVFPANKGRFGILKTRNYVGQLLLMECRHRELDPGALSQIHNKFLEYKHHMNEIDERLQISLEIYTKNCGWEEQPFLRTNTCHIMK